MAVHGLYEDSISTWTDREANSLWLRDLYAHRSNKSRILLFDYTASALASHANGSVDGLLRIASNLVAELCAQRPNSRAQRRPIIFICHGFGGLVVKRALAFSQTRRAPRVEHQRSIYLSTYAILFMGTPHTGLSGRSLVLLQAKHDGRPALVSSDILEGSEMINQIEKLFTPMMDDFCIFNFWEELETVSADLTGFVVEERSAAPSWENVERCGIRATHAGMVKFGSADNFGYQLVQESLERYTRGAVEHINIRWLSTARAEESPLHDVPTNDTFATDLNRWFLVERKPTSFFTGREVHGRDVKKKFSEAQRQVGRKTHAIFVIYGLGGSGKTHFCLKYAHDNRSR